jgi:hypothetical protein
MESRVSGLKRGFSQLDVPPQAVSVSNTLSVELFGEFDDDFGEYEDELNAYFESIGEAVPQSFGAGPLVESFDDAVYVPAPFVAQAETVKLQAAAVKLVDNMLADRGDGLVVIPNSIPLKTMLDGVGVKAGGKRLGFQLSPCGPPRKGFDYEVRVVDFGPDVPDEILQGAVFSSNSLGWNKAVVVVQSDDAKTPTQRFGPAGMSKAACQALASTRRGLYADVSYEEIARKIQVLSAVTLPKEIGGAIGEFLGVNPLPKANCGFAAVFLARLSDAYNVLGVPVLSCFSMKGIEADTPRPGCVNVFFRPTNAVWGWINWADPRKTPVLLMYEGPYKVQLGASTFQYNLIGRDRDKCIVNDALKSIVDIPMQFDCGDAFPTGGPHAYAEKWSVSGIDDLARLVATAYLHPNDVKGRAVCTHPSMSLLCRMALSPIVEVEIREVSPGELYSVSPHDSMMLHVALTGGAAISPRMWPLQSGPLVLSSGGILRIGYPAEFTTAGELLDCVLSTVKGVMSAAVGDVPEMASAYVANMAGISQIPMPSGTRGDKIDYAKLDRNRGGKVVPVVYRGERQKQSIYDG